MVICSGATAQMQWNRHPKQWEPSYSSWILPTAHPIWQPYTLEPCLLWGWQMGSSITSKKLKLNHQTMSPQEPAHTDDLTDTGKLNQDQNCTSTTSNTLRCLSQDYRVLLNFRTRQGPYSDAPLLHPIAHIKPLWPPELHPGGHLEVWAA